jgi:hypothetical protein
VKILAGAARRRLCAYLKAFRTIEDMHIEVALLGRMAELLDGRI